MKYVLTGEPKELAKVLQENRLRIQRGVIEITPLDDTDGAAEAEPMAGYWPADSKEPQIEDTKEEPAADAKKPSKRKK